MNDSHAMSYEYLIRRAHQCGRHGVAGANADDYRRLQRNYHYFVENKSSSKSRDELLSAYMATAGEIAGFIKTAIRVVIKTHESKISDNQYNALEDIEVSLITPDIDKLNKAVEDGEKIMLELGLYPK